MRKVLFIAIIGLLFASCEKDNGDYRDNFVGVYSCTIDYYGYDFYDFRDEEHYRTYMDTIAVEMAGDSMLCFKSMSGGYYFNGAEIKVDNEGSFIYYYEDANVRGEFYNDSLSMVDTYRRHWVGSIKTITGKKNKR